MDREEKRKIAQNFLSNLDISIHSTFSIVNNNNNYNNTLNIDKNTNDQATTRKKDAFIAEQSTLAQNISIPSSNPIVNNINNTIIVDNTQKQTSQSLISLDSSVEILHPSPLPDNQTNINNTNLLLNGNNIVYAKVKMKRDASFDIFNQDSRIFWTTQMGSPVSVLSILRFSDDLSSQSHKRSSHHHSHKKKKFTTVAYMDKFTSMESIKRRRNAESFGHLLSPFSSLGSTYDPFALDDPDLKTGRHKTVITLPSYISSIIQYARPSELKQELNEQFRLMHPNLDPGLSLSKIRNLKTLILEAALSVDLELATVSKAYAFFEKLVFSNVVNKENRRLIGACCLVLAAKINDHKEVDYLNLLNAIEKHLWVSAKDVRDREFAVFADLEFNLHIPREEYIPHMERLVSLLDYYSIQEYLTSKPPSNITLQYI